jgi:hypothetical protein
VKSFQNLIGLTQFPFLAFLPAAGDEYVINSAEDGPKVWNAEEELEIFSVGKTAEAGFIEDAGSSLGNEVVNCWEARWGQVFSGCRSSTKSSG